MRSVIRSAIVCLDVLASVAASALPGAAAPRTAAQIASECGACFVSPVTGTIRVSSVGGDRPSPFGPVRRVSMTLARQQDARIFAHLADRHGVIPVGGVYESGHPYWFKVRNATVLGWRIESSGPNKGDVHVTLHVTDWTPLPQ
jgi:hypothetical protein